MLGRSVNKNAPSSGGTVVTRRAVGMMAAFLVLAALLVVPAVALAQTTAGGVDLGLEYATATGLGTTDIRTTVATVIRIFLGLLGIIAVLIILYAGFLWMTAGGNEERISTAKKWLVNGVIGLIIVLSAFAIVQFIFGAAIGGQGGLVGTGSSGTALTQTYGRGSGTGQLGSGIIEYHYPEAGQTDVPRGTRIAITFKKPLVLSTVFRNYVDGPFDATGAMVSTPTPTDDYVCPGGIPAGGPDSSCTPAALATYIELNQLNVRIVPNADLESPSGGSVDEQFDQRYTVVLADIPHASATTIGDPIDPSEGQTININPVAPFLGNATADTNYRVALRGGDNGIKVWSVDPVDGTVAEDLAFEDMNPDGSYFWSFTVGTEFDTTPPQISAIMPGEAKYLDRDEGIYRNELLQVYFNEAVDPTLASGSTESGFVNIKVTAMCVAGVSDCDWGDVGVEKTVPGEFRLTNRFRTAEFMPSTPCDTVQENSCGEPVYCLPRNTELHVSIRAATLGEEPPAASNDGDGIIDMSGNSLDGNRNGTAEGPPGGDRQQVFSYNLYRTGTVPADKIDEMSDSVSATYDVSGAIDLEPPFVEDIVPKSAAESCAGSGSASCPDYDTPFVDGPSNFPVDEPIVVLWNKRISVDSIRTGMYDDATDQFVPDAASVVLRTYECAKTGTDECTGADCPCEQLDQPAFTVSADLVPQPGSPEDDGSGYATKMTIVHRPFFTGNDLGYTLQEMTDYEENIPTYVPVVRAKVRDSRQNCFWPSVGFACQGLNETDTTSCCDRSGQSAFNCRPGGTSP